MPIDQHPVEKIGKYRILGVLGKGGMGIVYKGLDPDIEREVAIKTIRLDGFIDGPEKEERLNRAIREAKAAGRLNHPNIITIYDVLRDADLNFIVMQYVDGQTLQNLIESGKVFSPEDVIAILKPVAEALDFAHRNGIVHRDIKPANILIDKAGTPFLADFGVARMETSTVTGPGTTMGTLSYMSPEQIMGKTADGRADFFALGVILYELLAGRKPFMGDNLSTIVYKIVHEEPQRVTDINQSLPPGYEDVLRRALAKSPDDRYQSGREMIADLEDPGTIAEATRAFRLKTGAGLAPGRRKMRPFALAGGLLLLAAAAGAVYVLVSRDAGVPPKNIVSQNAPKAPEAASPPPSKSPRFLTAPDAESLAQLKESFEARNFGETVRLAEKILNDFPGDVSARDFLNKAKKELADVRIASLFQTGVASYENGHYAACIQDMEGVLRLDGNNKEAQDYLTKADTALSTAEILAMIERRCSAEQNKDLEALLSDLAPGGLTSRQRGYYTTIFEIYERINSSFKGKPPSISLSDRTHASVNFWHAIQGVSRKDGQKKLICNGLKRWEMEKRGKIWKIVDIMDIIEEP
ncbi:MAG: serine/threonine-protein kinase [Candidatus Aminicenantes bacterium]|nr:serine/threonine-protein kinase [Candidatus Aminicenantes bacterium]